MLVVGQKVGSSDVAAVRVAGSEVLKTFDVSVVYATVVASCVEICKNTCGGALALQRRVSVWCVRVVCVALTCAICMFA